jgi:hypothetical protein
MMDDDERGALDGMSGKENRNAWRKPASSTTDHI